MAGRLSMTSVRWSVFQQIVEENGGVLQTVFDPARGGLPFEARVYISNFGGVNVTFHTTEELRQKVLDQVAAAAIDAVERELVNERRGR